MFSTFLILFGLSVARHLSEVDLDLPFSGDYELSTIPLMTMALELAPSAEELSEFQNFSENCE